MFIVAHIIDQLLVNAYYTPKIIITEIHTRSCVVVSYKMTYLACEISLN